MFVATERILQIVVDRILQGETTPVKREFQRAISEALTARGAVFSVTTDESNAERVLFSLASVGSEPDCIPS